MLMTRMTVTCGDDAAAGAARGPGGARLIQGGRDVRSISRIGRPQGPRGSCRLRRIQRLRRIRDRGAGLLIGSGGDRVTGAAWPWRSPGRARPRHAIHGSERNRCNA
jgi:hypothetical protein